MILSALPPECCSPELMPSLEMGGRPRLCYRRKKGVPECWAVFLGVLRELSSQLLLHPPNFESSPPPLFRHRCRLRRTVFTTNSDLSYMNNSEKRSIIRGGSTNSLTGVGGYGPNSRKFSYRPTDKQKKPSKEVNPPPPPPWIRH